MLRDRVRRCLAECAGETLQPQVFPPLPRRRSSAAADEAGGGGPPPLPGGPLPPRMRAPVDPAIAAAAHTELQRALVSLLVEAAPTLQYPARPDTLLRMCCDRFAEVGRHAAVLDPGNVERALHELHGMCAHAIRVEPGGLVTWLEPNLLYDFQQRLIRSGPAPAPHAAGRMGPGGPAGPGGEAGGSGPGKGAGKKRSATAVHDELTEVLDLVDKKSIKQVEKQGQVDELLTRTLQPYPYLSHPHASPLTPPLTLPPRSTSCSPSSTSRQRSRRRRPSSSERLAARSSRSTAARARRRTARGSTAPAATRSTSTASSSRTPTSRSATARTSTRAGTWTSASSYTMRSTRATARRCSRAPRSSTRSRAPRPTSLGRTRFRGTMSRSSSTATYAPFRCRCSASLPSSWLTRRGTSTWSCRMARCQTTRCGR